MQTIIDTLSQANRENAPSFTDELRRLLIKLSPLKQAEELLKMKISLPQEEDGNSGIVLVDSNEFSVRSASGWKQAFNKMRGMTSNKDDDRFDTTPATILEACADDMIGMHDQTSASPLAFVLTRTIYQPSGPIQRPSNYLNSVEYA